MTLWAARLAALRTGPSADDRLRVDRVGGEEGCSWGEVASGLVE